MTEVIGKGTPIKTIHIAATPYSAHVGELPSTAYTWEINDAKAA